MQDKLLFNEVKDVFESLKYMETLNCSPPVAFKENKAGIYPMPK